MGLDIVSASDKSYHFSYSALHYVRWMAYRSIGGQLDFSGWHEQQAKGGDEYSKTLEKFPNLCWHSDCDGNYTKSGHVEPFDKPGSLQTGNSVELLNELQFVKDNLNHSDINQQDMRIFNALYEMTKDTVENHDGVLEFH